MFSVVSGSLEYGQLLNTQKCAETFRNTLRNVPKMLSETYLNILRNVPK